MGEGCGMGCVVVRVKGLPMEVTRRAFWVDIFWGGKIVGNIKGYLGCYEVIGVTFVIRVRIDVDMNRLMDERFGYFYILQSPELLRNYFSQPRKIRSPSRIVLF